MRLSTTGPTLPGMSCQLMPGNTGLGPLSCSASSAQLRAGREGHSSAGRDQGGVSVGSDGGRSPRGRSTGCLPEELRMMWAVAPSWGTRHRWTSVSVEMASGRVQGSRPQPHPALTSLSSPAPNPTPHSPASPSPQPLTATVPRPAVAPPPLARLSRPSWGAAGGQAGEGRAVPCRPSQGSGSNGGRGHIPETAGTEGWSGTRGAAGRWGRSSPLLSWGQDCARVRPSVQRGLCHQICQPPWTMGPGKPNVS